MRFSLFTLVLVSLWIGTALLVWTRWEPWEIVERSERTAPPYFTFEDIDRMKDSHMSPDRTRRLQPVRRFDIERNSYPEFSDSAAIWLADYSASPTVVSITHPVLWSYRIPEERRLVHVHFSGDEKLVAYFSNRPLLRDIDHAVSLKIVFGRRHPEWWWGHLLRAEVWGLIGMTGLLAWNFVRRREKSR